MPKYYAMLKKAGEDGCASSTAEIYIFGEIVSAFSTAIDKAYDIDAGDVSGLSFAKDLQDLGEVDQINVHISSPGGVATEGLAIYNTLKNHPSKVVTICDGIAASAASVIFMAGDERIMNPASLLMVHNPYTYVSGNSAQLREEADTLDKFSKAMISAYVDASGMSEEQVKELLDGASHEGTYITADEAVENGLATSVKKIIAKAHPSICKIKINKDELDEEIKAIVDKYMADAASAEEAEEPDESASVAEQLFNLK
jgi:ATP-dependent Clp protease protease subunit